MANSITDQLNSVTSENSQKVAFTLLDMIQGIEPKGLQLSGVALMFLLMCERYKQNPREVLDKSSRVLYDAFLEGRGEYIRAIQNYLKEEL
jgi:hypothetical protein